MMRKAIVLVAVLAGLALAASRWIGYVPTSVSALPRNLENAPQAVLPPGGTSLTNTDTLKYDDNAPANAWASYVVGNGFGTKFVRPADPITLDGTMIYLWDSSWPVPGSDSFLVKVFAANGPNGTLGDSLFESPVIDGTRGAWNYVPIGVPIVGYDFYIFYIQADSYPNCPGMALDTKLNAPDGRQFDFQNGSAIAQTENPGGDWCIRAIYDWTPSTHNVGALVFGNLPQDTVPAINLTLQATYHNYGIDTEVPGIHVKMHITGPDGYVKDYLTDSTVGRMAYRGQQIVTFHPAWHIPDTAGDYVLQTWSELPTDEYRGNDTMSKTISAAHWFTYANWALPHWVTWAAPERTTLFHPADFGLNYPVEVNRIETEFYWSSQHAWDDSSFVFVIYGNDGVTELYESDSFKATNQVPIQAPVDPPITITSGDFYAGIRPRSINGNPTSLGDSGAGGHSYYGSPNGGWTLWNMGELFHSVGARTATGLQETPSAITRTAVSVTAAPTLGATPLVSWQVKQAEPVSVNLYDATGRLVRTLFSTRNAQALSGSFRVDTRNLSSGLYIIKLQSAGQTASAKLIVR
jgi:hypothetical protein